MMFRKKSLYHATIILLVTLVVVGCSPSKDKFVEEAPILIDTEEKELIVIDSITDKKEGVTSSSMADGTITMNGEGNIGFTYSGGAFLQVHIKNTGATEFEYKIKHMDDELVIQQGTLIPAESIDNTFDESLTDLPKGDYGVLFNQSTGAEMSAYVKTELNP
ncbi:hypothetical protein [Paenibacillus glacialis]|uniref:Uncharacterized protein n=1 Tax=Paenibacillus glacialis TaxID=494026 RepID=A0A162LWG9_9BACL|nr:hypothetical protein [Paenibacillus glacialis]OAB35303.1 hypothetical protein PGLA_22115 [Paenibacillus glacialis]